MVLTPSKAFGKAVVELRKKEGLSQEGAALACGIDRKHFGNLERGKMSPTLRTVWKIATQFGVEPSELLGRAEELLARQASRASASAKAR